MVWQLLAIWAIIALTVIWFVRDERRIKAEARLALAAKSYAKSPKFRFVARNQPEPAAPKPRSSSLLRNDRAYFDQLLERRSRR